jgi:four helix bundle protein
VGVKTHRDLRAWQQADAVRRHMIALCARPDVKRDFGFCNQADRAASSACRNLAEGFVRYRHPDFARFVTIAHASLGELLDSLDEAQAKGYLDARQFEELDRAVTTAMRSANALRRYLQNSPTPKEQLRFGPKSRAGR